MLWRFWSLRIWNNAHRQPNDVPILSSKRVYLKLQFIFFYQGFLSQTVAIHRTAIEERQSSFIPLCHFHPLCIPLHGNIPLCGNAVCNFFILSYCTANFLTKFCSSDPSFNRNILTPLYLKSEHLHMHNYAITRLYILYTSFTTRYQLETYIDDTINKWHQ